jgi:TonB family protein
VVKSKNYRNVSGYVELEFTETVAGFWGMRFPGERTAAPANVAPVAAKPAAPSAPAPKIETPVATSIPPRVEQKPAASPVAPVPSLHVPPAHVLLPSQGVAISNLHLESKPAQNLPHAPEAKPVSPLSNSSTSSSTSSHVITTGSLPKAPGLTDGFGSGVTSTARLNIPPASIAPKAPVVPPAPPAHVRDQSAEVDALRRESERLQEQLAAMLQAVEIPAKIAPPSPVAAAPVAPVVPHAPVASSVAPPAILPPAVVSPIVKQLIPELSAKVVDIAKAQQSSAARNIPAGKSGLESSLDQGEVKIPSWLEPLARNAATHAQTEIATKEDAALRDRTVEYEVQDVSALPTPAKEEAPSANDEVFETHLMDGAGDVAVPSASRSGNKGVMIAAIAAGLVLAIAGGTWYSRHSNAPSQVAAAAEPTPAPVAAAAAPIASQPATHEAPKSTPNRSNINSEPVPQPAASQGSNSQAGTPSTQFVKSPSLEKSAAAELSEYKKLAEPAAGPVKKPSLGEVHLAAPKANHSAATVVGEAEDISLSANQPVPSGDAMGGGLVGNSSKQPVAPAVPLPVGGDVKPARLLSSTPPTYPTLAKTQHIEGAVKIDALVDASGKVSSMKVVSGPVLLHQAAMEALRTWKYQAATLDGKPVSMHLTVTVQFRLN